MNVINVEEFNNLRKEDKYTILDVRTVEEYTEQGFEEALNIPLSDLPLRFKELTKDTHYLIHCKSGHRASEAMLLLEEKGYKNIKRVVGKVFSDGTPTFYHLDDNTIQIYFESLSVNCYYLKREKALIDLGFPESFDIFNDFIKNNPVDQVILTHSHYDHLGHIESISKNTPIYCSQVTKDILINKRDDVMHFGIRGFICPDFNDYNIKTIDKNILDFEVIDTPGHCIGSISLYNSKNKTLFSGDLLFSDTSIGRVDLPESSSQEMYNSLLKLDNYDIDLILSGHGKPCTIKEAARKARLLFFNK